MTVPGTGGVTGPIAPRTAPTDSSTPTPLVRSGSMGDLSVRTVGASEPRLGSEVSTPRSGTPPRVPPEGARLGAPDRALARESIPSRAALLDKLGQPKSDLFGGHWKRSTGYKDVLQKLHVYDEAMRGCKLNQHPDTTTPGGHSQNKVDQVMQLALMLDSLTDLEQSLQQYVDGSGLRGHKDEMRAMLAQVKAEKAFLSGVLDELDATPGSPRLELHELVDLRRSGVPMDRIQKDANSGLGMSAAAIKAHYHARVPYSDKMAVRQFHDGALERPMKELGSGAMNTVSVGSYRMPDGSSREYVFKADRPEAIKDAEPLAKAGVSRDSPCWAGRNIATSRLDQRLRLGVIPHTEPAIHGGKLGCAMEKVSGVQGHVTGATKMELSRPLAQRLARDPELMKDFCAEQGFQPGRLEGNVLHLTPLPLPGGLKGEVASDLDYGDPVLRRELTKLQWLDALCGQIDRHPHNYIVELSPSGRVKGVKGIDNDQAFAKGVGAPPDLAKFPHAAKLPEVVDKATFDALMALTPDKLEKDLEGLVTPEEILAAQDRLEKIKEKLAQLDESGHVLGTEADWSRPDVSGWMGFRSPTGVATGTADRGPEDPPPLQQFKVHRAIQKATGEASQAGYASRADFALSASKMYRAAAIEPGLAPDRATQFLSQAISVPDMERLREMARRPEGGRA